MRMPRYSLQSITKSNVGQQTNIQIIITSPTLYTFDHSMEKQVYPKSNDRNVPTRLHSGTKVKSTLHLQNQYIC